MFRNELTKMTLSLSLPPLLSLSLSPSPCLCPVLLHLSFLSLSLSLCHYQASPYADPSSPLLISANQRPSLPGSRLPLPPPPPLHSPGLARPMRQPLSVSPL